MSEKRLKETQETAETRAVKIAAKIMQAAGLCRYDSRYDSRERCIDEKTCDRCIERWLLEKARKELRAEKEELGCRS